MVLGKVGKSRVIVYSLYSADVLSYGWKRSKIISLFVNRIIIVAIGIYNTERK
jgi:Co/Zn/Cd efflux system component